mgnify:CR=1 FL=1
MKLLFTELCKLNFEVETSLKMIDDLMKELREE